MKDRPSPEQESLHAPSHCIGRIVKGQDEGISLSSDLIAVVVRNLGSHDAVMNGGGYLHDLQTIALHCSLHAKLCIQTAVYTLSCKKQLEIVGGDGSVC